MRRAPPKYPEQLPEVESIAWLRRGKGYVLVLLKSQGKAIIEESVLTPDAKPESPAVAHARASAEIGARMLTGASDEGGDKQ